MAATVQDILQLRFVLNRIDQYSFLTQIFQPNSVNSSKLHFITTVHFPEQVKNN